MPEDVSKEEPPHVIATPDADAKTVPLDQLPPTPSAANDNVIPDPAKEDGEESKPTVVAESIDPSPPITSKLSMAVASAPSFALGWNLCVCILLYVFSSLVAPSFTTIII